VILDSRLHKLSPVIVPVGSLATVAHSGLLEVPAALLPPSSGVREQVIRADQIPQPALLPPLPVYERQEQAPDVDQYWANLIPPPPPPPKAQQANTVLVQVEDGASRSNQPQYKPMPRRPPPPLPDMNALYQQLSIPKSQALLVTHAQMMQQNAAQRAIMEAQPALQPVDFVAAVVPVKSPPGYPEGFRQVPDLLDIQYLGPPAPKPPPSVQQMFEQHAALRFVDNSMLAAERVIEEVVDEAPRSPEPQAPVERARRAVAFAPGAQEALERIHEEQSQF
jgi:hypothetical protein